MKPEAQNIAIAEACGAVWCDHSSRANEFCPKCGYGMAVFPHVDTKTNRPIPDYLNDLNAMHEAEKVLDAQQRDKYRGLVFAIHATATQRAEAFLRTVGKWEGK